MLVIKLLFFTVKQPVHFDITYLYYQWTSSFDWRNNIWCKVCIASAPYGIIRVDMYVKQTCHRPSLYNCTNIYTWPISFLQKKKDPVCYDVLGMLTTSMLVLVGTGLDRWVTGLKSLRELSNAIRLLQFLWAIAANRCYFKSKTKLKQCTKHNDQRVNRNDWPYRPDCTFV